MMGQLLPKLLVALLAALLFFGLAGCAGLKTLGPLPEDLQVRKLPLPYEEGAPVAWHPGGGKLAVGAGRLLIFDPATGAVLTVAEEIPAALAWSGDGRHLAASFIREEESFLRIFAEDGRELGELRVAGRIHRLVWGPGPEILAAVVQREDYAIGAKLDYALLRWAGRGEAQSSPLHSTMVRRSTAGYFGDRLYRTFHLALAPLGDEILYTRLHEPPANRPHLRVMLRHLESGREQEIGRAELDSGAPLFLADSDGLLYGDGSLHTYWLHGPHRTITTFPVPGYFLAATPTGRSLFIDGRLFKQGEEIAVFPEATAGYFSPLGNSLLICANKGLYLLSGLDEDHPPELADAAKQKLLQLRQWRAEGLISAADYEEARRKVE